MSSVPALPVGNRPFWDLDHDEDEDVRPISESCVLIHSLKQSRERWLLHTFPKFSSKTRGGKGVDMNPQPHTMQSRGTCDLAIGPHIFPDTTFYEVHYLPPQSQGQYATTSSSNNITRNPYWHTTTPYQTHVPAAPPAQPAPKESDNVSTPLISSLTSVTTITPNLISQVNSAASSNPILSNLLQLAAGGRATPDQLKTLGLLIQSLASLDQTQPAPVQSQPQPPPANIPPPPPPTPVKEFDIVLEFKETPNERWTFPRTPAFVEQVNVEGHQEVHITTCVPFDVDPKTNEHPVQKQSVTFHLQGASPSIFDTLNRWIGGTAKMEEYKSQIQSLNSSDRLFLGYQIPEGSLLSQLQAASTPSYVMKPLRQGPAPPPRKRAAPQRKPAVEIASTTRKEKTASANGEPTTKRSKTSRAAIAVPIQCRACNKTDVPLIMGGRFCRPCVNAGAAINDVVPQIPNHSAVSLPQSQTPTQPAANPTTVEPATSTDIAAPPPSTV